MVLPGAGRPDDGHEFARMHREADVDERRDLHPAHRIDPADVVEGDDRVEHVSFRSRAVGSCRPAATDRDAQAATEPAPGRRGRRAGPGGVDTGDDRLALCQAAGDLGERARDQADLDGLRRRHAVAAEHPHRVVPVGAAECRRRNGQHVGRLGRGDTSISALMPDAVPSGTGSIVDDDRIAHDAAGPGRRPDRVDLLDRSGGGLVPGP